jgi:hypothetical protein
MDNRYVDWPMMIEENMQEIDRHRMVLLGLSMLIFALIVSALMGIYQETLYATYGKYPEEALFYSVRRSLSPSSHLTFTSVV